LKRIVLRFAAAVLGLSVALTACKKMNSATIATDPQLAFALQSDSPVVTFGSANPSDGKITATAGKQSVTWTAGTASITRFRLNAKRGGVASEYVSTGLTNVDLFALNQTAITIPKGDYTEAKATIVFTQTNAAPYPVTLLGVYSTTMGTTVPVEFDMNDSMEIGIALSNIIADGTKNFTSMLAMHLNMFLNTVSPQDIDGATRTNGTILITKTINPALYTKIKANMLVCGGGAVSSMVK
jgi:hypothetical protein